MKRYVICLFLLLIFGYGNVVADEPPRYITSWEFNLSFSGGESVGLFLVHVWQSNIHPPQLVQTVSYRMP